MIMLVTLISFYYYGFCLIISCSFFNINNGAVVVSAAATDEHYRNSDWVKMMLQPNQQQQHYNNLSQIHQQQQRDLDQQQQRKDNDDQHQSQSQPPQANDIFAKLTHLQGRIDENNNNYLDDNKDKSVARRDDDDDDDAHGSVATVITTAGFSSPRETYSQEAWNKKRYAYYSTAEKRIHEEVDVRGAREKSESVMQQQKSAAGRSSSVISCKDESGNDVEWFIAYKLPQTSKSQDPILRQGSKYYFLTSSQKLSWKESVYPINSNQSILATTLQILWNNEPNMQIAQLAYNDQPPAHPAVVMNGHTKGLVWTSTEGGVWLQHSCPHFPNMLSPDFPSSYPPGGLINGQMFFCMSLGNTTAVDVVGSILQYTKPFVYNYSIPATMEGLIPQLAKVAQKNATIRKAPWYNSYQLKAGELELKVYAKGPKFRREIYSSWIAPEYETGLDVQSWLNGAHPYNSNCTLSNFPVFNVLSKNITSQAFPYTDDHSKWAVSVDAKKPVTCVGDLNRMKPQRTRGGTAICMTDSQIWSAFKSLVKEIQPCNSSSLKQLYYAW